MDSWTHSQYSRQQFTVNKIGSHHGICQFTAVRYFTALLCLLVSFFCLFRFILPRPAPIAFNFPPSPYCFQFPTRPPLLSIPCRQAPTAFNSLPGPYCFQLPAQALLLLSIPARGCLIELHHCLIKLLCRYLVFCKHFDQL